MKIATSIRRTTKSQYFDMRTLNNKWDSIIEVLKGMGSAVLAYSGGVDSTFLLKALQSSGIQTLAITAFSETTPRGDLLIAEKMVAELGIEHRIIKTDELAIEEFVSNTPERCFFCKDERFRKLTTIATSEGYRVLLDGSNVDDTFDHRPGRKAAVRYNVRSPLIEVGLSKKEIRALSRQLGLPTWDKPSSPCLATRIPYGQRITREALRRIEKAEEFLREIGFHEVRVRDYDSVARIEVEEKEIDLVLTTEKRRLISKRLQSLGYRFVSLDLNGYRMGSMNRIIEEHI